MHRLRGEALLVLVSLIASRSSECFGGVKSRLIQLLPAAQFSLSRIAKRARRAQVAAAMNAQSIRWLAISDRLSRLDK